MEFYSSEAFLKAEKSCFLRFKIIEISSVSDLRLFLVARKCCGDGTAVTEDEFCRSNLEEDKQLAPQSFKS